MKGDGRHYSNVKSVAVSRQIVLLVVSPTSKTRFFDKTPKLRSGLYDRSGRVWEKTRFSKSRPSHLITGSPPPRGSSRAVFRLSFHLCSQLCVHQTCSSRYIAHVGSQLSFASVSLFLKRYVLQYRICTGRLAANQTCIPEEAFLWFTGTMIPGIIWYYRSTVRHLSWRDHSHTFGQRLFRGTSLWLHLAVNLTNCERER